MCSNLYSMVFIYAYYAGFEFFKNECPCRWCSISCPVCYSNETGTLYVRVLLKIQLPAAVLYHSTIKHKVFYRAPSVPEVSILGVMHID